MTVVLMPVDMALAQEANPSRALPADVERGETFNVTVNFTAPADNFFLISLCDSAPEGWNVTVNKAWCTPAATSATGIGNETQLGWAGPFSNGTFFTAVYKVTVPEDADAGFHTFVGSLQYYFGGAGPYWENIDGDSQVEIIGAILEGRVTFVGRGGHGPKWVESFTVALYEGFGTPTKTNALWTGSAITNTTGFFTITLIIPGTYDIGIKNRTSLSVLATGVTLTGGGTTQVNFGEIKQGDCKNDDDKVTLQDRILMYSLWGGSDFRGDLKRDGDVGLQDRILMYKYWDQEGNLGFPL